MDNLFAGKRENLNSRAKFYRADICSPELFEVVQVEKPDCVSHHAAQVSVQVSIRDPLRDANSNLVGSLKLPDACLDVGVKKFIDISTGGAVYGDPLYLPCDEDYPIQPLCPYGVSKHAVEQDLHISHKLHGLN